MSHTSEASGVTMEHIRAVLSKVQARISVEHQQALTHPKQPVIYQPYTLSDDKQGLNQPRIYSWWLPAQYQRSILAQLPIWQTQWPELYVEEELNHRGKFAVRYLCQEKGSPENACQESACQESICHEDESEARAQKFAGWFAGQVVTDEPQIPTMTQFPECIQALLASGLPVNDKSMTGSLQSTAPKLHHIDQQEPANISTILISQLIGEPHISHIAQLPEHQMIKTLAIDTSKSSMLSQQSSPSIIQRFTDTVDCECGSYQPRTITQLLDDMGDKEFLIREDMWVIKVKDIPSKTITSLCQSSTFWAPRVQGQLYTMGVFEQDGLYYVWGAGDRHPADNMMYIQALIDNAKTRYQ